ncbi:MAG: T9SS type A sorting domain-containing protein [Taibaiella sp.]|nr:T9SS type A sorting domain-containing protein [Taibaiella sp.]
MHLYSPSVTAVLLLFASAISAQTITTIAGNGTPAFNGDGITASVASLNGPFAVAVDNAGNVYIADRLNNRIRKVDISGIITTIAGNGISGYSGDGGPATNAQISAPTGVAVDNAGNVFIADRNNHCIRKIHNDTITNVAGNGTAGFGGDAGSATAALLDAPRSVATDNAGNIYIADQSNNRVRKINTSGIITTVAGNGTAGFSGDDGPATDARLYNPAGIAVNVLGDIYIADVDNQRIRKVTSTGKINTYAGTGTSSAAGDNGPATAAGLSEPIGVAVDQSGKVFIADGWNFKIRMVNASGTITSIAGIGTAGFSGDGGPATYANLNNPYGVAVDSIGNIYIADYTNNRIRKSDYSTSVQTIYTQPEYITIYPVPTNTAITIDSHLQNKCNITVAIIDINGRTVEEISVESNVATIVNIEIPDGIYMAMMRSEGKVWQQKLTISHNK